MPNHSDAGAHTDVALRVLGCRGSIPVSGDQYRRYGGNTTSFALVSSGTALGFLDAGTGLDAFEDFGIELASDITVLLTHYHWDHIQGLSMLPEIWTGVHGVTVVGPGDPATGVGAAIRPPWFPVAIEHQSNVSFAPIDGPFSVGDIAVTAFPVNHPQGGVGFRLDGPSRVIAVVTDHEAEAHDDTEIVAAAKGADVVIFDAQYLPSEIAEREGWGHSSWRHAVDFAERVGATTVVLTSHDPRRSDDDIDAMVAQARTEFSDVIAATPGLDIGL